MDIISFNEASTANGRIENFIENPDSSSGVVTVPKVIASGETITIPAGRVAILPDLQVDGDLVVDGDLFIPTGSMTSQVVQKVTSTDNAVVRFNGTTGDVQNSGVIIDDNGNVGVGIVSSPLSPLHIYKLNSNDTIENRIQISRYHNGIGASLMQAYRTDTGSDDLMIAVDSVNSNDLTKTKYRISSHGEHKFYGSTTSTERMRIDSSGNVGIGTSTPSTKTEISSYYTGGNALDTVNNTSQLRLTNNSNVLSGDGSLISFKSYTGTNPVYASIAGWMQGADSTGAYGDLVFATKPNYATVNPIERMRINTVGNVGVGVIPNSWYGTYKVLQINNTSLTNQANVVTRLSTNYYIDSSNVQKYIASDYATQYMQANGAHTWSTAPSGTAGSAITWNTAMTLGSSGNLLVGTSTDNGIDKLQVNGDVNINGNLISKSIQGIKSDFFINDDSALLISNGLSVAEGLYAITARSPYFQASLNLLFFVSFHKFEGVSFNLISKGGRNTTAMADKVDFRTDIVGTGTAGIDGRISICCMASASLDFALYIENRHGSVITNVSITKLN